MTLGRGAEQTEQKAGHRSTLPLVGRAPENGGKVLEEMRLEEKYVNGKQDVVVNKINSQFRIEYI